MRRHRRRCGLKSRALRPGPGQVIGRGQRGGVGAEAEAASGVLCEAARGHTPPRRVPGFLQVFSWVFCIPNLGVQKSDDLNVKKKS